MTWPRSDDRECMKAGLHIKSTSHRVMAITDNLRGVVEDLEHRENMSIWARQ
jgi:hypothetical protein